MFLDGRTQPIPKVGDIPTESEPQWGESRPGPILVALSFVVMSFGIMQTMLVPSIGVLQQEFDTTAVGASWAVLSATMLFSAVVTPLVGRLGDRYGKRRVLMWSLSVYLLGTAAAVLAPNLGVLIGLRAVQGIGLSLLPLTFAIIREALPSGKAMFGLALTSGLLGGTAGVGLLIGGTLVDQFSWHWLFVVDAVVILIALVLTTLYVPESKFTSSGNVDIWGTLALAGGLVCVLLGVTQGPIWGWLAPAVLILFAAGIVILGLFAMIERRVAHPVIDLRLLTHRPLLMTHLGAFALGMNQFLFYVLLPKLAQLPNGLPPSAAELVTYGFGTTVTGAALIVLPGTLLGLPASWSASRMAPRFGKRAPLVLGLGLASLGGVLVALGHAQVWQIVVFNLVCSAGHGFAMAALPSLVNGASKPAQSASANSVNTVARIFGGAVGSQVAAAVLSSVTIAGTSYPAEGGFTLAFVIAAMVGGFGALIVLLGRARKGGSDAAANSASPTQEHQELTPAEDVETQRPVAVAGRDQGSR